MLLYFNDVPSTINDGSLFVLSRGGQLGGSPPIKVEYGFGTELPWFNISYGNVNKFDEIIYFNGVIYALDRFEKLYQVFTNKFVVLKLVIAKPVDRSISDNKGWWKRLEGSTSSGKLFLIMRSYDILKV